MGPVVQRRLALLCFVVVMSSETLLAQPARAQLIPESGTLALFGGGLIGVAALIRRHFSD
jgi:hypothetical protein